MKQYTFYVAVYPNGRQIPQISFHDEKLRNLNSFAGEVLATFEILDDVIKNINEVINGKKENFGFGEDELHNFEVRQDDTEISNSFDQFEPFIIPTIFIRDVLIDWKEFIVIWKGNKIPNLKYG